MSEEEIIKTLQDLIEAKFSIKEIRTMNLLNENDEMPYVLTIFERHTIQGLLDLYNKQKKEIKEWQKAYIKENNYWLKFRNKINKIANNDKDCSDNEVIKAVKNLEKENDKLTKLLLGKSLGFNDYISKKKIKAKIKALENINSKFSQRVITSKEIFLTDLVQNILKELLEEE